MAGYKSSVAFLEKSILGVPKVYIAMPLCFPRRESTTDYGHVTPVVVQLIDGYCTDAGAANAWMACGSVTLVKQGSLNVLVDCGSPWDGGKLLDGNFFKSEKTNRQQLPQILELKKQDVRPQNVQYLVCTHGHIDHIGNLNLFTESQILLDTDFGTKPGFYGTHNYSVSSMAAVIRSSFSYRKIF